MKGKSISYVRKASLVSMVVAIAGLLFKIVRVLTLYSTKAKLTVEQWEASSRITDVDIVLGVVLIVSLVVFIFTSKIMNRKAS